MATILVVDDDRTLCDLLTYALKQDGHETLLASTGREALHCLHGGRIDLVLADVAVLAADGLALLGSSRVSPRLGVVLLAEGATDEDVAAGLAAGADDYVVKPFHMRVLMHRIRAVLRRRGALPIRPLPSEGQSYRIRDAVFDTRTNRIAASAAHVSLTPTESRILHLLLSHEGQILPAERIFQNVWGSGSDSAIGTVKTHIRRLRRKLDQLPGAPQPVRTVPGRGYVGQQTDDRGDARGRTGRVVTPARGATGAYAGR